MSPPTHHPGTQKIVRNPFHVLGLTPEASRAQIEREGQKILSMLSIGLSEATHYNTPLGPRERTPELVRHAMAELRDPSRRLSHELWAAPCGADGWYPRAAPPSDDNDALPWEGAFASYGWSVL